MGNRVYGYARVKEYEGVDGVIEMLKRHIDMIVKTATDPETVIPDIRQITR